MGTDALLTTILRGNFPNNFCFQRSNFFCQLGTNYKFSSVTAYCIRALLRYVLPSFLVFLLFWVQCNFILFSFLELLMLVLSMTSNIVMYSFPNEQFFTDSCKCCRDETFPFVDILASTSITHKKTHRGTFQRIRKLSLSNCRRCSSSKFTQLRKS